MPRLRAMSAKQRDMLLSFYRDGEAIDICDFDGDFGWHNRERVIDALVRRGYLTEHCAVTDSGRKALGVS